MNMSLYENRTFLLTGIQLEESLRPEISISLSTFSV